MSLDDLRGLVAKRLASLSNPVRILVLVGTCLLVALVLFWMLNQTFYYFVAKSYVDDLADAYGLNRGFTTAILWLSFAAVTALSGWTLSFSKTKRNVGWAGLLTLIVAHSIAIGMADRNFAGDGKAEKCFVTTRDNVKILSRAGIDPETGRECRPLTPVMAEKITLYQQGKRPTRITSGNPAFFSEISGEPIVWYAKNGSDQIELFDLMGYHPQTGEELKSVNREIAALWRSQADKAIKRVPVRIDPNSFGFFDPVTGAAKVWFWRSDAGEYEFYDGPGFHPRTGDQLEIVTRDSIAAWKRSIEEAAAKRKAEQERLEREANERRLQEERERQERAEAERRAKEAEIAVERVQQQSGNDCDRLAANPTDQRRTTEGVPFDVLKAQAEQALDACTRAVQLFPNELRYQYQLGRAMQFKDRKRAFEIMTSLTSARYPAAFDNLGGMYLYDRKDVASAIRTFKMGESLDDADSMVSLADLIGDGRYSAENPYQAKWSLLSKAAQLNHAGAQKAVASERSRLDKEDEDRENARKALEMFGQMLGGIRGR